MNALVTREQRGVNYIIFLNIITLSNYLIKLFVLYLELFATDTVQTRDRES